MIENFNSSEIQINKWNGFVEKKGLRVKQEFVDQLGIRLGIPLRLRQGVIENFYMKIPWNKLLQEGCQIIIDHVHISCYTLDTIDETFI